MDDCLFCRIGRGEIPSKRVHDDELCFAFEDINPQAPTHVLVCPKEHLASLASARTNHKELLGHLLTVGSKLVRERGHDAYRAVVNTGAEAGQSVFHLHVHVLAGRPMKWPPG
jgi:histidine triad (HIT) family protein